MLRLLFTLHSYIVGIFADIKIIPMTVLMVYRFKGSKFENTCSSDNEGYRQSRRIQCLIQWSEAHVNQDSPSNGNTLCYLRIRQEADASRYGLTREL